MDVFTNQRPSFLSHILVLVTLGVKYEFLALLASYSHIIQINLLVFGFRFVQITVRHKTNICIHSGN